MHSPTESEEAKKSKQVKRQYNTPGEYILADPKPWKDSKKKIKMVKEQ